MTSVTTRLPGKVFFEGNMRALLGTPLAPAGTAGSRKAIPKPPKVKRKKRKPRPPKVVDPTGSYERPDRSFAAINKPIFGLISRSFPPASQIRLRGLENWAHFDHYDVVATSGLGRPATAEEKRAMLRALLTDHFKLVASFDQPEPGGPAVITISQLEPPIEN